MTHPMRNTSKVSITYTFSMIFHKIIIINNFNRWKRLLNLHQRKIQQAHGFEVRTLGGPKTNGVDVLIFDDVLHILCIENPTQIEFCSNRCMSQIIRNHIESIHSFCCNQRRVETCSLSKLAVSPMLFFWTMANDNVLLKIKYTYQLSCFRLPNLSMLDRK